MSKYILFDNQEKYKFLESCFDGAFFSPKTKKKFLSWLKGILIAFFHTNREDTIVCWFDFQAVLLFYLSLFCGKRRIICLNILLKPKKSLKNKLVRILYKIALSSKNFEATITSLEYGKLINRDVFRTEFNYVLLHDVYHDYYESPKLRHLPIQDTVFCGGRNGRDWNFIIQVAQKTPMIKYVLAMPATVYENYKTYAIENVRFLVDVPYDDFIEELCKSNIVCLPLDTEAPAGLIVLFQAAANEKLIIATNTATTREYIHKDNGVLLASKVDDWIESIQYYMTNKKVASLKAKKMKEYLKKECSEQIFINTIKEMIK